MHVTVDISLAIALSRCH